MAERNLADALSKATESAYGVAKLAADGATTAGLAAQASDTRLRTLEQLQDLVAAMVVAGTDISIAYDDGAGTITIAATGIDVTGSNIEDMQTTLAAGSIPVVNGATPRRLIDNPDMEYDAANNRILIGPATSGGGTLSIKHVEAADGGNSALDVANSYTNPTQPTSQYGAWVESTGTNDTNVGLHIRVENADKNYALITEGDGNVGIGVANPEDAKLMVGGDIQVVGGNIVMASGYLIDGVDVSNLGRFKWMGFWNNTTDYVVGDVVFWADTQSSYICILDDSTHATPDLPYWNLFAAGMPTDITPNVFAALAGHFLADDGVIISLVGYDYTWGLQFASDGVSTANRPVEATDSRLHTTEQIQDMLASFIVAGANVTLTYNDAANTLTIAASGMSNPMTTANDIIVGGTSGAPARLAKGSDGQVLTVDPTTHALVWATPSASFTNPMSTSGDMIYGGSSGAATRLPKGSDNDVLSLASGVPAWINRGLAALQNPMTGAGDLIVGSGSSTLVNLNLAAQGASMSSPNGNTTGHDPSKVIDSDDVTYWESNTTPVHPANLVADLGQSRTISYYRVLQASGSTENYAQYKVQSSPDNVTWTDRTVNRGEVESGLLPLASSATTRYWRIITTAGNLDRWRIYALELWGTPAVGQAIRLPLGPDTTFLGAMNGAPTWLARQAQAPMQSPMSAAGDLIYGRASTLINLATTALGAAFNASGSLAAHPLADAFDGSDSTYWDAAVNPNANGWLSVDLGIARAITNFRILQNGGGSDHYSNNFKLQSSTDGFTWTDRNTGISGVMDTGVIAVTSGPITARYWRAYSVSGNTLAWEIYSFELWGAGTGVPTRLAVGSNGDVLTLASGLPTWAAPSGGGSAVYPTHATFWHDEATVITGNALALSHDTNQNYAWFDMQNAPANGDVFEQTFTLAAGTYVFSVLGLSANSRGRLDWTVDGVNIVALEDWYSGGLTYNVLKTHTGIVIATSGLHTLRATVNGKNASSSGYEMLLTKYWFR